MTVYKREGALVYSYDFQRGGRRYSGSTGETKLRRAEAIEVELKAEAQAAAREGRPFYGRELTLAVAVKRYWSEVGQHTATPAKLEAELTRLADLFGPATPLAAIDDAALAQAVGARRAQPRRNDPRRGPVSAAQVNRSVTQLLRRVLTRAKDVWRLPLPREPRWRAHMLAEPRERVRELRLDEEVRLEAVERDEYRAPRVFAQLTGLRRREVASLTWPQVDFAAEAITVVGKGDKPHVLPITDELRDILAPLQGHHPEAVFTFVARRTRTCAKSGNKYEAGKRYPVTYEGLGTHLGRTFAKAKLDGFRIHDLRHTAATRTLRATGNLRLVQKLLNHASPAMTARYAHTDLSDLREALSAASADTARRRNSMAQQDRRATQSDVPI